MFIVLRSKESEHIGSGHKYVSSRVTEFDSKEAKNVRDVPVVLGAKLNQYHNLNEELDFLVRNTFRCFASLFIHNTVLITSCGNDLPSKTLLLEMVTHWHSSSIIHPHKYRTEVWTLRF